MSVSYLLICFKKKNLIVLLGFPGGLGINNLPANSGDKGLIPGLGISPREGNGNPLQYSCLGNPMERGAWWATVHGVTKSWHDLSNKQQIFLLETEDKNSSQFQDRTTFKLDSLKLLFLVRLDVFYDHLKLLFLQIRSDQSLSRVRLGDPMNHSTPGLPVHHQLPEFTQTHVQRVSDAIQPSHPLSSPSPLAPNPSQHQSLFQWVNSSHEVVKVLEFQL